MSNPISSFLPARRSWVPILLGLLGLAGLYVISRYNFLLFHSLTEAFSIIIAIAVFAIFWNTRHLLHTGLYLVIGFGCLFGGFFDIFYVFAYPGMSVFPGAHGNMALQAKTVAQTYVSLSCIGAFLFLRRRIDQNLALLAYSVVAVLAVLAIFDWRVFPACFVEGVGITPFARIALAISSSAYLGALILFVRHRHEFDDYVFRLLITTLVAFLVQDTVSAMAIEMNGPARTVAHLCQVVALYFVYKAFVEVGLRKPYDLLFRSQQQSAEELKRSNEVLQQRAAQLRALASELALTEQRQRRYLAQALHDRLQQTLFAARMLVDRVKRRAKDEGAAESLRQIDELLGESIAESRSLTLELSPPVLYDRGLVGGLQWLARWFLEKHHLPVSLDFSSDEEPAEEATRVFLFQTARELLFNTVKHAHASSAQVQLKRLDEDRLRLVVTDNGQGFDPSAANNSTSSGFGLFSIRERLELLGGKLEVHSSPGQGAQLAIEVPCRRREPATERAARRDISPVIAGEKPASRRIRLLLADDHAIVRQGLAEIFVGYPEIELVGEASDGQEAVELALRTSPDVVLMDVSMPGFSGIEATRRIVQVLPRVRIIGLSMDKHEDMAVAMREAGAADYLSKEVAVDALVAAVLNDGSRTC